MRKARRAVRCFTPISITTLPSGKYLSTVFIHVLLFFGLIKLKQAGLSRIFLVETSKNKQNPDCRANRSATRCIWKALSL